MNAKITIAGFVLSGVVLLWMMSIYTNKSPTAALTENPGSADLSQKLISLSQQIKILTEQLAQAGEKAARENKVRKNQHNENSGYMILPQKEAMLPESSIARMSMPRDSRVSPPQVIMVNPTPEQNENYEVLKAKLDDLTYVSSINIQEFSSMPEVRSLPDPLQMVLLNKAMAQFNQGNVTPETFFGGLTPVN